MTFYVPLLVDRLIGLRRRGVLAVPGLPVCCAEVRPPPVGESVSRARSTFRALLERADVPGAQGGDLVAVEVELVNGDKAA